MGQLILILQLIPSILKAVKAVEDEIPLPNAGKAKLDMILGIVQAVSNEIDPSKLTSVIGVVVSTFKALGIFK